MFKLVEKRKPSPLLLRLLKDPHSRQAIRLPGEGDASAIYPCSGLTDSGTFSLLLPLIRERSPIGCGLVRGLWFDRPLSLWAGNGSEAIRITASAYRCHIAGEIFSRILKKAREEDSLADFAAVWELVILSEDPVSHFPETSPLPEYAGPPEIHLDSPLLHPAQP